MKPDLDADVHPLITTMAKKVSETHLGSHRFGCFSSWKQLIYGVDKLIVKVRAFSKVLEEPKTDSLIG